MLMATKDKFNLNLRKNQFATRHVFTTESFAGVDYQEAENRVAKYNARESLNVIFKNGIDQTRDAWEQVAKADARVNSLIKFKAEDGMEHIIARIGKYLY